MKSNKFIDDVRSALNKFGPEILAGCAVIFTGLAIKSAIDHAEEAVEVRHEYDAEIENFKMMTENSADQDAVKKTLKTRKLQKTMELALVYKWSFIFGFSSAVCMVCSTKLSGSKLAAAYALAKLNEDKLKIAMGKVKEMFGEDAENTIRTKIAKELAFNNHEPIMSTKNPGLNPPLIFVDDSTGNHVETTMENMESAIKMAKGELKKNHVLSFKKWLLILGCPVEHRNITDVGWNVFNPFDVEIVKETIEDSEMYLIKYINSPSVDYRHMTK